MENQNENINTVNPYLGLLSYTTNDSGRFWGRDAEIKICTHTILNNTSTLIFGPSGCGKTSLINAGIIPELKSYSYHTITVTPRTSLSFSADGLWIKINNRINDIVNQSTLRPIPKFQDISWSEDLSIWEKLNLFDFLDDTGFINYILVEIDQFEEIFQQNYNIATIKSIFAAYEFLCGYYKDYKEEKLLKKDLVNIDSFNRYKDKISTSSPHRFLVAIRQDFMFEMESYAEFFPLLEGNRICIHPLNEEQAFKIITTSKTPEGKNWFSKDFAIRIIQDLTGRKDFEINNVPEIEVDTMMLSLYLSEICKQTIQNANYEINNEGHDVSCIIKVYYVKNINYPGIEVLEKELISTDGKYRRSIPLPDAIKIMAYDDIKKIAELGIFNIYSHHSTDWVELRHDKLCTCAAYHLSLVKIKLQNQKLLSPYMFLVPQGRVQFNNSYLHIINKEPSGYRTYSGWLQFVQRKGTDDPLSHIDLSSLLSNSATAHDCTLKINLNDILGNSCYTDDGIEEISVAIVKGKLYEISFFRDQHPYALYYGAHKIVFYYDANGRMVLCDYIDVNNNRLKIVDGYTSIMFEYNDNDKVPNYTYYLNIPSDMNILHTFHPKEEHFYEKIKKYITPHRDGNYGFQSKYNENDVEICRTFVNSVGEEKPLNHGFSELRFEKTQEGGVQSISYFLNGKKHEIAGIHKIEYFYDECGNHVVKEIYYNSANKLTTSEMGCYGVAFQFGDRVIKTTGLNKEGVPCVDNEGTMHQRVYINSNNQVECVANFDENDNPKNTTAFSGAIQYIKSYPNSKISEFYTIDKDLRMTEYVKTIYNIEEKVASESIYDEEGNLTQYSIIAYENNTETIRTYDMFGKEIPELSFERKLIAPNTYAFETPQGIYASVLDDKGNVIKNYKCDNDFNHIINEENGIWEVRMEYQSGRKIKDRFYSSDNMPYEIEPGVFGYEYEYGQNNDIIKTYELDEGGNRNLRRVKHHKGVDYVENYEYYDESQNPIQKTSYNGISTVKTTHYQEGYDEIGCYDINDELCNCSEGWAVLRLEGNKKSCYDFLRRPINCSDGWHAYIEEEYREPDGKESPLPYLQHCYVDINNNLVDGEDGDAGYLINKLSIWQKLRLSVTFKNKELNWKDSIYSATYLNSEKRIIKADFIVLNKETSREINIPYNINDKTIGVPTYKLWGEDPLSTPGQLACVFIKQDLTNSKSGCRERDVIIKFGEWDAYKYIDPIEFTYKEDVSYDCMIDDFQKTFNEYFASEELITIAFARLSDDNKWNIYSSRIRIGEGRLSIGRMVDRKISKVAYKEIFEQYNIHLGELKERKEVNTEQVIHRVKELLSI